MGLFPGFTQLPCEKGGTISYCREHLMPSAHASLCEHGMQRRRLISGRQQGLTSSRQRMRSKQQSVRCMAHPRRVARVAKQIEREVGTLLLTDRVMQSAVCPEVRLGLDSAVSAIASVTEVELSKDMQVAKIYISVYSDPHGKTVAMRGLSRLEGYVRKHIATAINMRLCPEIRFIQDDSIQRGEEVLALLDRIRRQDAGEIEPPAIAIARRGSEEDEEGGEWEAGSDADVVDDLDEEGGFLGDMDEEEEEEPGSRGRSTPAAEKSENEGDAAAEDEEEDHDEEEEDDDEDDDDLDDEVDVESLRAWGIDPEDPLALAHMPNIEGEFAPTVREPWRPERELKRVRGRAKKTGRKTTRRKR